MKNGEIVIYTTDHDALNDLQRWISSEFITTNVSQDKPVALGNEDFGIKVIFEFVKDNWERLIMILKNWLYNYNKDIELTFENGDKKVSLKCPSKRVDDKNMDRLFSSLDCFFENQ